MISTHTGRSGDRVWRNMWQYEKVGVWQSAFT